MENIKKKVVLEIKKRRYKPVKSSSANPTLTDPTVTLTTTATTVWPDK